MKNNDLIIIWRERSSVDAFIAQIKVASQYINDIKIVNSIEQFGTLKEENIEFPVYIFILVEIDWYSYGSFQGLEIAKDLMIHYEKERVLNIHFVSFMSRAMIMGKTQAQTFTIAQQFQLMQLPITSVKLIRFSQRKYSYKWKVCLVNEYLYNVITHELDKLSNNSKIDHYQKERETFIKYYTLFSEPVRKLVDEYNAMLTSMPPDLVTLLRQINIIKMCLGLDIGKSGIDPVGNEETKGLQIAIVEDNKADLATLQKVAGMYFDVRHFCFSDGEKAKEILAQFRKNGIKAVLLDLELLAEDNGSAYTEGIDLFEMLEDTAFNGLPKRIITSLPRAAVMEQFPGMPLDHILFKKNGAYVADNDNLHLFFLKLIQDIKIAAWKEKKTCPSGVAFTKAYSYSDLPTPITLNGYYYSLLEKESSTYNELIHLVKKKVKEFFTSDFIVKDKIHTNAGQDKKRKSAPKINPELTELLIRRLIFLIQSFKDQDEKGNYRIHLYSFNELEKNPDKSVFVNDGFNYHRNFKTPILNPYMLRNDCTKDSHPKELISRLTTRLAILFDRILFEDVRPNGYHYTKAFLQIPFFEDQLFPHEIEILRFEIDQYT